MQLLNGLYLVKIEQFYENQGVAKFVVFCTFWVRFSYISLHRSLNISFKSKKCNFI